MFIMNTCSPQMVGLTHTAPLIAPMLYFGACRPGLYLQARAFTLCWHTSFNVLFEKGQLAAMVMLIGSEQVLPPWVLLGLRLVAFPACLASLVLSTYSYQRPCQELPPPVHDDKVSHTEQDDPKV